MLYEAIFIVCSLSPLNPWMGDRDTGPTCGVYERVSLPTESQCLTRLEDTLKILSTKEAQERLTYSLQIRGPYTFVSECRVKVAEGPLPCNDCED
jgi:hypothetical protein